MKLVKVELKRFFSRRAVIVLLLLGMLGVFGTAAGILYNTRPISDADLQSAQARVDEANRAPYVVNHVQRCIERTDNEERCRDRFEERVEWYLYRDELSLADHDDWMLGMAGIAGALMLLCGATFIGADFNSGSLSNQVLFRPRRRDVWIAKSVALGVAGLAYGVLAIGGANLLLWAFAKGWNTPIGPGIQHDLMMAGGRAIVLTAVLGLTGFAIAMITRYTAAALGLLAFYGVAFEAIARVVWPESEKWLLSNHAVALVAGGWELQNFNVCSNAEYESPQGCTADLLHFTTTYAAGYLGILAAVVVIVSCGLQTA